MPSEHTCPALERWAHSPPWQKHLDMSQYEPMGHTIPQPPLREGVVEEAAGVWGS